jgi:hypothetical protein
MTAWPARRSANRVLCGREVGGRYVCQGEVARIDCPSRRALEWSPTVPHHPIEPHDPRDGPEFVFLPPGLKESPPGSGHWVPNSRGRRIADRHGAPTSSTGRQVGQRVVDRMRPSESTAALHPMTLPFTRPCPHCGTIAEVTAAVLES